MGYTYCVMSSWNLRVVCFNQSLPSWLVRHDRATLAAPVDSVIMQVPQHVTSIAMLDPTVKNYLQLWTHDYRRWAVHPGFNIGSSVRTASPTYDPNATPFIKSLGKTSNRCLTDQKFDILIGGPAISRNGCTTRNQSTNLTTTKPCNPGLVQTLRVDRAAIFSNSIKGKSK